LAASPTNIRILGVAAVDVIHITLIIVGFRSDTFVLILVFDVNAVDLGNGCARES
jgi:hypothetical protein